VTAAGLFRFQCERRISRSDQDLGPNVALPVPMVAGGVTTSSASSTAGGSIVTNLEMLYIAIGIIGATVMPHVTTKAAARRSNGRRRTRRSP
jgi:hypothetical protein